METTKKHNEQQTELESKYPILPHLHFDNEKYSSDISYGQSSIGSLPAETVAHCLSFCDWGDLAKLSTVCRSFKNIIPESASFGGTEAKWQLSQSLLNGNNGMAVNSSSAIQYLTDLSSSFVPAMKKLSMCYLAGDGVQKSNEKGLKYLENAVDGGDNDAAHQLALIFEYGEYEVDVDVIVAAKWFRTAAENGHLEAMAEYAMCCELGCGVEQSDAEALEWYTRAANAGHIEANYSVGEIFEEAKGVPQSDEEACLWYYKAAVMGDDDAKRALLRLQDIARIVLPGWSAVLDE